MSTFEEAKRAFELSNQHDLTAPRDVATLFASQAKTTVEIFNAKSGRSSFFPNPKLPPGFEWPMRSGQPMIALAEIDLAEVAAVHQFDWLPKDGTLVAFVDEEEFWENSVRMEYFTVGTELVETPSPAKHEYKHTLMQFATFQSWPSLDRMEAMGIDMTSGEIEILEEAEEYRFGEPALHQIGGFPCPIQNDTFEIDAELKRQGLPWTKDAAPAGTEKWHLLLQIDSDDDHNTCWGDAGMFYIFVHEDDARQGDFSRIYSQCDSH